jgi:hypothetical protein
MSWTLVYANDTSGAVTFGKIDTLINAVRNGASVNVVLQQKSSGYTYSFRAQSVHVKDGVVSATNTLDVSSHYVGTELLFLDDSYYYMLIANTSGTLDQLRWNVGEHTPRGHDQGHDAWNNIQWFVD